MGSISPRTAGDRRASAAGAAGPRGSAYDWLSRYTRDTPDSLAVSEWTTAGVSRDVVFRDLLMAVDSLAVALRAHGLCPGDRLVLVCRNAVSFYRAFVACQAVGVIAVPAPVPTTARQEAFRERLRSIVEDSEPRLILTEDDWTGLVADTCPGPWPTIGEQELVAQHRWDGAPFEARQSAVALLQYTSGSTGRPRGVPVSQEALRTNSRQALEVYGTRDDEVAITWVPLFHDLGLMCGVVRPLFSGYRSVLVRPEDFVRRPLTWLEAIDGCRGSVSAAPNFAYELCTRKVTPAEVSRLDLATWRVARNGGEVVRAATIDRFVQHFAAAGLAESAMCPAYGCAEATLTVTTCTPEVRPERVDVAPADLRAGRVVPVGAEDGAERALSLISSGVPLPGTEVQVLADSDRVGAVLIRGPQVITRQGDRAGDPGEGSVPEPGWHDTGDLGFIRRGHLFVVGRRDDTLVHHGVNFFSGDIATVCARVDGLRTGRLAAFAVHDDETGDDAVHLVAELRPDVLNDGRPLQPLAAEAQRTLATGLELFVSRVHFVEAGALPVTTSGKVRVSEVARRYCDGALPLVGPMADSGMGDVARPVP
jgi:acyl-CoA synthetase (AMP-forming)/AMP-acid ligase II